MSKIKKPTIDYTSRDFETIKKSLVEYTKRYYSDIYQDFNEASFGSLMLDTVAYVGDMLSFYLDYQVNETFLETANETKNVLKLAKQIGYKQQGPSAASGIASFYIFIPATINGNAPDQSYIPVLRKNSSFFSDDGTQFILTHDVRFDREDNEVAVGKLDPITGIPLLYAIKSYGNVVSGEYVNTSMQVGDFENFLRVQVPLQNVVEIISVKDSEGFEYYEVEHLAQDHVYRPVINRTSTQKQVSSFLRPFYVPRRFVLERVNDQVFLQFGYGVDETREEDFSIADPSNIILEMSTKQYKSDLSFDPSRLIKTDKFGLVPQNTTLFVEARIVREKRISIGINTLNNINNIILEFEDLNSLNRGLVSIVKSSLEVTNEEKIIGDSTSLTTQEIKTIALSQYSSQNRAVTKEDYRSLVYRMPKVYGTIKRTNVVRDQDSFKRNINIFVLTENEQGHFEAPTQTLKENLKIWINENKMINDTIDILDGKVLNLGIKFSIIVDQMKNSDQVLGSCLLELKNFYSLKPQMGESFFITDIYKQIRNVNGVLDVVHVDVFSKNGGQYSNIYMDIEKQRSADGRYIEMPENVVYEIKFASEDIKGVVV